MRNITRKSTLTLAFLFVMITALATPFGKAEGRSEKAVPLAPGHNVYFTATGLPDGVAFTITGLRVNNGGNPTSYSTSFTTPNMSAAIGADPGSTFTYSGFPVSIAIGTDLYQLVSTIPVNPFVVGASGGATTVTAAYATTCVAPAVLASPVSQTVVYGEPVTFTLSASGTPPLSYEWYKDGGLLPGADQSTYSISSANMSDAGSYQAVVSNSCGSDSSSPAQLTVNKANQTITFVQPASPALYATSFAVAPTASSGLPVSLATFGSCTNTGYDVTMTSGTGTCTLVASQAGDGNYNPAGDVVRTVDAAKADQTIDFPAPAPSAIFGTVFTVTLSASSGLPVDLSVSGGCSNLGTQVTMTSGSTPCTLTATQSGNDNYKPAGDVQHTVTAIKADQAITFTPPASPAAYGTSFVLSASASSSLPVAFDVSGVCSLAGTTVSMTGGTGDCTITASQAGDDNYDPAGDVQHTVAAMKADQAITFTPPASPAAYGTSFVLSASASSSLPVAFDVSGVCNLAGTTVSMTSGTGSCAITASQAGDDNYNPAAEAQHTVAAMKADQAITFTPPVSPAVYGTSFDLSASASSSLPVAFDVSGVCSLVGSTVTMTGGAGDCTITASQTGNGNYNPAAQVVHMVEAAKASQEITFEQPVSPVKYQTSFTVSPEASSNLPVVLAASGSCTNSGYIVTMTKTSGTCVLTASQAGDLNYQPAEDVQRSVDPAPNGNVLFIPLLFGS